MSDVVVGTVPKSPAKGGSSPYKVYRQGFLLKCQPRAVRKKLHRYWFVLFKQKDMLAFLYFQDEDHYLERKKNEGFFRIDDCTSIDVIPEHMGRKNSFCITTPRAKYNLVSESRYELHHWLLALHGAIEDYKNLTAESSTGKKKSSRNRSQSITSPPGTSTASHSKTYPRIKPSRPAPPAPPKDKRKGDEENVPPPLNLDRQSHTTATTSTTTTSTTMESFQDLPSPTTNNLDNIVADLIQQTKEQPATLDYTLTEDEYLPMVNGGGEGDDEQEGRTSGSFFTSMPLLNTSDKDGNTGGESTGNSDENGSPGPSHDRHLSYSHSQEFNGQHEGKKRISKKRATSIKGRRSVSPPNLPPPPPPPTTGNEEQEPAEEYTGENVIKSFDQPDEHSHDQNVIKLSPKPPPPQRTTSLNPNQINSTEISSAEVNQYLDEAFNEDDQLLQQLQVEDTGSKSPGILRNKGPELSVTKQVTKRTVVFNDNKAGRYEPMVDHESLPSTVAEAKLKLFGMQETESYKYKRISNEPQDELLEAIESALQPTSYMEQGSTNPTKVGFTMEVNAPHPPQVPPPTRPPQELPNGGGRYSLQTSPKEPNPGQQDISRWSNPTLDDTPTTSTFSSNQDTMYRSIV